MRCFRFFVNAIDVLDRRKCRELWCPLKNLELKMVMMRLTALFTTTMIMLAHPICAYLDDAGEVETYCQYSPVQWGWAMLSLLDYPFEQDDHVLDLGCRDGAATAEIAKKVPFGSVTGIDRSGAAIAWAEQHHTADNVLFVHADSTRLEVCDQYDVVTGFLHLNRIEDLSSVLLNTHRALVKDGVALFTVPIHPSQSEVETRLPSQLVPYLNEIHSTYRHRSVEEYIQVARKAGFKVICAQQQRMCEVFANRHELEHWRMTTTPEIRAWPQEIRDLFFDFHLEQVNRLYPQRGDGRIYAYPMRLELKLEAS